MLLFKIKELRIKKIVRFTEYRINHVRNRRSGMGGHFEGFGGKILIRLILARK